MIVQSSKKTEILNMSLFVLLLMAILTQSFFTLMRSNFMSFTFFFRKAYLENIYKLIKNYFNKAHFSACVVLCCTLPVCVYTSASRQCAFL